MKNTFASCAAALLLGTVFSSAATTLTVTNTDDDSPGSLRQAILDANADGSSDPVAIEFDIPGAGVQTIAPLSPLPSITRPVTIDGYTQQGASTNSLAEGDDAVLLIQLTGTNDTSQPGLYLQAGSDGSLIRGLIINGYSPEGGIYLGSSSNVIAGNFIGTDATGQTNLGNYDGVDLAGSSFNTIGGVVPAARNIISGNTAFGIYFYGLCASNVVQGNFIGTDCSGTNAVPNINGVVVYADIGNVIGGTSAAERNIISGNSSYAIVVESPANVIQGNYIGTDVTGAKAVANGAGIDLTAYAPGCLVGGASAGAGNLISSNIYDAIVMDSSSNIIQGNLIGVDATGTNAMGNGGFGLDLDLSASGNLIGGTTPDARNVIACNFHGIGIYSGSNNVIQGNFIGTDATGTRNLGNAELGIYLGDSAPGTLIGGTAPGAGNLISGNGYDGINNASPDVVIQGNFIGTDVTGTNALFNGSGYSGIILQPSAPFTQIGGTNAAARNVISGDGGIGIYSSTNVMQGNYLGIGIDGQTIVGAPGFGITIDPAAAGNLVGGDNPGAGNLIAGWYAGIRIGGSNNIVQGNLIGTDITGTLSRANYYTAVTIWGGNNLIGGLPPGARNLISGNEVGIDVNGNTATGNTIQGNFIGTDITGTKGVGNAYPISIEAASGNLIGGTTPEARNVISGNGSYAIGIGYDGASNNVVQGNYIGLAVDGITPLPNYAGVRILNDARGNLIGGTVPGAGNWVAYNERWGISMINDGVTNNAILGNSIFSNGWYGIDLAEDGVTPNDAGDADDGQNHLQNFPEIASAKLISGDLTVRYRVDSAVANSTYPLTVEFFIADANGQGKTFIYRDTYSTPQTYSDITFTPVSAVNEGDAIVATATDANGNTSEFSVAAPASPNQAPVVANPIPDTNSTYGAVFGFTFPANTFSDPDAGDVLTYSASNVPPGITFDGLTRTFAGTNTDVGTYSVTITATDNGSPPLSTNDVFDIVVGKAPLTVRALDRTNTYGDFIYLSPYSDIEYTGFVFPSDSVYTLDQANYPQILTTATNGSPVGSYPITVSGGSDPDYAYEGYQGGTLTLSQAPLQVLVDSYCRPLGQTNPVLTATITGLRNSDNITVALSTSATNTSPLGNYPINVAFQDPDNKLPNYVVNVSTGVLSVVDFTTDYRIIHSFGFTNLMGNTPYGLLLGSNGLLYGGINQGTFRMNLDGTGYDAYTTNLPGIEGQDGLFYGVSQSGGSNSLGMIFKVGKDGTGFEILHHFAGGTNDGALAAALIQGTNGALFGITSQGGLNGDGIVFQIATNGDGYSVLHHFQVLIDGRSPTSLIEGSDGLLYGTTQFGGPGGFGYGNGGTVFKLDENDTNFTVLYTFDLPSAYSGIYPGGLIEGTDGALYGVTGESYSGVWGRLFKLQRDGTGFTNLHTFTAVAEGGFPNSLISDHGTIYGVTDFGSSTSAGSYLDGYGTLFKISEDGTGYTLLASFTPTNGIGPNSLLLGPDGDLRGTCANGGIGAGTVFRVSTNGTGLIALWQFNSTGGDGAKATAAPVEGPDGVLYGVTEWGGNVLGGGSSYGIIYRVNKDGSDYQILHNFSGTNGDYGYSTTRLYPGSGGWLYGMTSGVLFKLTTNGTDYAAIHDFGSGSRDSAVIEGNDGRLYGVRSGFEGAFFKGFIYSIATDGSDLRDVYDFGTSPDDGFGNPQSLVQGQDGLLYGTSGGGTFNSGTIFVISTNGTGYTILHQFGGGDGAYYPSGGLMRDASGVLFGATSGGGTAGMGTVFRMDSDGGHFQILHNVLGTHADGAYPMGPLAESADGTLFGTTAGSLSAQTSTLFHLQKDGSGYCVLQVFGDGVNGELDTGGVIVGSDGSLYGTTQFGGVSDFGAIFKVTLMPVSMNQPPTLANLIPDQTRIYGASFDFTFAADTFSDPDVGQTLSYTASGLPPGVGFDGSSRSFSGTPTVAGTFPITVTATDNGVPPLSTNAVFNLTVVDCSTQSITNAALPNAVEGAAYSVMLVAANGAAPYTFTVTGGTLPGNVTLASDGLLSGTPTNIGSYPITISATGALGCVTSSNYVFNVTCPILTVYPATLPNGTNGTAYAQTITAGGGTAPYSFTLTSGNLPPGLTLSSSGSLSGTPTSLGTYSFGIIAGDTAGCGRLANYSITIVKNAFLPTGSMNTARFGQTTTLLPDGKVLVAGGFVNASNATNGVDVYDPATGTWTPTGPMTVARGGHTATLLSNGHVLVVGGESSPVSAELYDPVTGTWTATGALSLPRVGHTATLLSNGMVLVTGGPNDNFPSNAELYDPATGTWSLTGALALQRQNHSATLLPDGKVLVVGGNGLHIDGVGVGHPYVTATAEIYDPAAGTWASANPLPEARYSHTATRLTTGQVLVAGGTSDGSTSIADAELYDPATGTWTATGALNEAREQHTATLLPNGKVFVAGGSPDGASPRSSVEVYDPGTGQWSIIGTLQMARFNHTATLLTSGSVLLAGGIGDSGALSSAELFDPSSDGFTTTASLSAARDGQATSLLPNGKVLVAGGYGSSGILGSAELYDPASGTWLPTGPLMAPRAASTATLLPNGKVLVAGGADNSGTLSSSELYDPASGTWSSTGAMNNARDGHTATLLPNGKVLVVGGENLGVVTPSAELYDPNAGTWQVTDSMAAARNQHTATLLPNGKVLVAGGVSGSGAIAGVELYDPVAGTWAATGSLLTARAGHTATLLPTGNVLITGGYDSTGTTLASSELYDPGTGIWATTGALNTRRLVSTSVLLPNGKVLLEGGLNFNGPASVYLSSVELYDPAAGTWTETAHLTQGRSQSTATLLLNGKVLVAGGYNGSRISSAELYDVGLDFSNSWQSQITTFTSPLNLGSSLTLTGSGFRGIAEGSGGNTQDSPADYPVVQLRSLENGQIEYLSVSNWSESSFTSAPVNGLPPGWTLVTMFVNGIPSSSSIIRLDAVAVPTTIILVNPTRLPGGSFRFEFANTPGATFTALSTTDLSSPIGSWTVLGPVTEVTSGHFQFTDSPPADGQPHFYRVRSP